MSALADMIDGRQEEIVQKWVDHLFATDVPRSLQREEVIDSLRQFLTEISRALREEPHPAQALVSAGSSPTAREHGTQRFLLGYDIGALVQEYGTLRNVIFDMAEAHAVVPSLQDLRVFSKYLVGGIADAATQYALSRDEELQKQTARHISFLAHELRNPLSSVRLSLELMREKGHLPQDSTMTRIDNGLRRLSELIDQSLLEMRLKAVPEPQREDIPLATFLKAIAEESAAEVEAKGLRLSVEVHGEPRLWADPKLLRSVLSNLVRNAVKFTHKAGSIHLRAKRHGQRVVMEVEDECGGLPEGKIQELFNPFVQVGLDRSGFGLGLAIAKQAVLAHQGELRVHNLPGKGCVFVLDLPLACLPPEA